MKITDLRFRIMTRKRSMIILAAIMVLIFSGCRQEPASQPNIILILADDLGYGDPGCYGQQLLKTPNIDRLAGEGMMFTQHYSGSTVCAPSRSCLMTGQHTGHTPIRGNMEMQPEGQYPLEAEAITIAELLKQSGYTCGAFGKWGLGPVGSEGDPLAQGFDEFYGYNCQRLAHNYYPEHLWHNDRKVMLEANRDTLLGDYAPFLIQEKVLQFIERNRDGPFFCYIPTVIPHAELFAPDQYIGMFRGKFLPEKVYNGCDPGCDHYKTGGYGTQKEAHAAFAAMIHILDEQVGQIIDKIEELGLSGNTLIIFTSDNGPHLEGGADPDYFNSNGPFQGYKRDLYEGGIRVPMLVRWPGRVKAGTQSGHISAFWDVLPTLSQLAGTTVPENIDGISFLPALLGETGQQEHEYLYWEFYEMGGRRALRKGDWKAIRYDLNNHPEAPLMLFNLVDDPGEEHDVSSRHPELIREMEQLMQQAHTDSEVFTKKEK